MSDEPTIPAQTPETQPAPVAEPQLAVADQTHLMQSYEDDLSKAMDATDATVIQHMLIDAKGREEYIKTERTKKRQRKWYTIGTVLCICFALGLGGYGWYHYQKLTVPAEATFSVGVFPESAPVVAQATTIGDLVSNLREHPEMVDDRKPTLITLVRDDASNTLISKQELFSLFGGGASEPFLASFGVMRLGAMRVDGDIVPFVIGSTSNTEITTKELLIAEPDMLKMLYQALGIDRTMYTEYVGKEFVGTYVYNLPLRVLFHAQENPPRPVLYYGYATDRVVVFSTNYTVIKAVYDTIIAQQ